MRWWLVIFATTVCLGFLDGSTIAQAKEPCARPKALYAAGYYAQAESEYKALLGTSCATTQLVAQARAKAEQQAAAAKPKASEQLQQALRLQGNGFEDASRKLVEEAVRQSATEVQPELRSPEQRLGWWREALGLGGPVVRTLLEIAAVVLALVLAGLLIATAIKALALRFCLSARLEGFTGSADATVAPLLGAALSEALERMSDDKPGRKLTWTSGTEPKFELPSAITEAVPSTGLLAGLVQMIDKLLYRNLYLVSGTVHPPHEHRGAGVTLVVANRSGRESEQVTVWESEFLLKEAGKGATDSVRYERLILPAAIWLGYRPTLGSKKDQDPPLGARDWRSYALFALGEIMPDSTKQRLLYERALDLDAANVGARLNLAGLLLQRPDGQVKPGGEQEKIDNGSSEGWRERLERAGDHLQVVATSSFALDQPIWYRGRYMEAIRRLYLAELPDGNAPVERKAAKDALKQLLDAMRSSAHIQRLRPLIDALDRPTQILSASIELVEKGKLGNLPGSGSVWLSASGEYNLACFWARAAVAEPAKRQEAVLLSVKALRRALTREGAMAAEARVDPVFDAIREEPAFKAVVPPKPKDKTVAHESSHYAITLDPGPLLMKLVGRRES